MRQLAIIVILAQIGSYVPAQKAELPIFDAIYTRIGAAETWYRVSLPLWWKWWKPITPFAKNTPVPWFLFDELGRGTATYDGMASPNPSSTTFTIARVQTLFATHYHELTALSETLSRWKCPCCDLGEMVRLPSAQKIESGPADKSYGIHVAKIAGLQKNCWSGRMRFWPSSRTSPASTARDATPKGSSLHRLLNNVPLWGDRKYSDHRLIWFPICSHLFLKWKN